MKQFISFVLIFAIYLGLFSPIILRAQISRGKSNASNMNETPENGLKFRLSEGAAGAENRQTTSPASGEALSENQTANLLKRLPEIKSDAGDKTDFAKRQGSLPPPKTGKTVNVKFPSSDGRGAPKVDVNSQTLEVLRRSPEGNVSLAPDLSVTFSQPMVAVTAQEEAAQIVPVEFSPALPEGNWRWLGTKTLMFDAVKRFPMATKFTARIPPERARQTDKFCKKTLFGHFKLRRRRLK